MKPDTPSFGLRDTNIEIGELRNRTQYLLSPGSFLTYLKLVTWTMGQLFHFISSLSGILNVPKIYSVCRLMSLKPQNSWIFKVDNQQGPTVQHMDLCSVLCGSLDERGVGGGWIHVLIYAGLSPFAVHLKLLQHCLLIHHTPIQNKKFKNKQTKIREQLVFGEDLTAFT